MNIRRVTLEPDGARALARALSPPPPAADITERVAQIVTDVRARGDDALVELTRRFDCRGFTHDQIRVPASAITRAVAELDPALRDAILVAAIQVRALAEATRPSDIATGLPLGQQITVRQFPVVAAGLYVPGGRAAYPSSLIMAAVPAQVAGVGRIAVVTPPTADGAAQPSPG
jgi:histidinol dehydrogenase